ncbi:hypothetical protein SAMN04488005_2248 [Yoonia tamlensis]|uniref:Transmembrane protein (PGPGW) n=1 Tax=Yoonia tamlensis TaxID=390270 RepID=A0A1I6GVY4_9RHOB|nr:hypothetical protein [Yoonia tamlensis]SFR46423.1 hypothetical protein SAMN04488005_2248 [Yoonia tamlensis]
MTHPARKPGRERFEREFAKIAALAPWINRLRKPGWMILRVLLGLVLIAGGFLAILPVFGLWMIPVGLLFLAIDIPPLQGPIAALIVRARRRWQRLRKPW